MNKVLLVYEDYADLMAVEATLKKVGFDVIGLSSEYAMAEQILAFNPDIVVGSGRGGKVSSLGVGKRLKEATRWQGKAVLIFPANFKPSPQELIRIRVDMILESPVPPLRLVQVIGKILGHDEAMLLDRLNKAMHVENTPKSTSGAPAGAGKVSTEGEAIYVRGAVEGAAEDSSEIFLHPDRVQVESEDSPAIAQNDSEKISFKFGDRISGAVSEPQIKEELEQAFPDVDLKSLERELLGGGVPEVERVELTEFPETVEPEATSLESIDSVTAEEEALKIKAQEALQKSENGLRERISKYTEMVSEVKVSSKSTVTRVEARRRQRLMAAEWDNENLNKLDELRREFTKALFKK